MTDIRSNHQSDEKKIADLALRVEEQRKKLSDTSTLSEDEIGDAVDLEQQYFEELASIINDIREEEEGEACDGRKFTKEEKAYLKKWEDELNKSVKEFKSLNKSGYLRDKADEVLELGETDYTKAEHRDNLSDAFEESKTRLNEYYENLGYNLEQYEAPMTEHDWTVFIKKPKKAQLESAIKALDEQHPQWTNKGEYFEMKALIATLISEFPDLVKKNAPLEFLEGEGTEPPKSSGCLSMILAGCLAIGFVGLKASGLIQN
jgi:myosin heavy subunit